MPSAALVGVLLNLGNPEAQAKTEELREAAGAIGLQVQFEQASSDDELEAAFATLVDKKVAALLISSDPFFDSVRLRVASLAARAKLPAIHTFRDFAVAGGLMSYGISLIDGYRLAGVYAGEFLPAQSRQIYRSSKRRSSSSWSISRLPRRWASRCRLPSSPAPTR